MSSKRKLKGLGVHPAGPGQIAQVYECQRLAYAGLPASGLCDERLLGLQQQAFPDGFLVAVHEGKVVGYATSLIVQLDDDSPWYSYDEITGGGAFTTHNSSGDTLYGADIAVRPDYRGKGVAAALYEARKKLLKRLNLRRMVAGGRIPGYRSLADELTPEEYVDKVVAGELADSSLNAHLKAGYQVRGVHMGYLHDEQSLDFATFLEYVNPHFKARRHFISAMPVRKRPQKFRLCLAQSLWGSQGGEDAEWEYLRGVLDGAEALDSHLVVLPDFAWSADNSKKSQDFELYEEFFAREAAARNLYIVVGALPRCHAKGLNLESGVFAPGGSRAWQPRLHLTHLERKVRPGDRLRVMETPLVRLGILNGYDNLFPELARRLTLAGAQLLVCPVASRERNEYLRYRFAAQARALENVVYVAVCNRAAPDCGYPGESLVLTPCDFGFPDSGVAARAGVSGPTYVVHDVDLGAIETARQIGTVRPLRDRRVELCGLTSTVSVEHVKLR